MDKKMKSPDEICSEYYEKGVKLTVKHLDKDYVLTEGDAESLEFIGNLILSQARFEKDCGFQIASEGSGNAHFSDESSLGIYIHRLPCEHGKMDKSK